MRGQTNAPDLLTRAGDLLADAQNLLAEYQTLVSAQDDDADQFQEEARKWLRDAGRHQKAPWEVFQRTEVKP